MFDVVLSAAKDLAVDRSRNGSTGDPPAPPSVVNTTPAAAVITEVEILRSEPLAGGTTPASAGRR